MVMEAGVEFLWWWRDGVGWGLHSHFHVQPNYSVEVGLCCVVVGVVTMTPHRQRHIVTSSLLEPLIAAKNPAYMNLILPS